MTLKSDIDRSVYHFERDLFESSVNIYKTLPIDKENEGTHPNRGVSVGVSKPLLSTVGDSTSRVTRKDPNTRVRTIVKGTCQWCGSCPSCRLGRDSCPRLNTGVLGLSTTGGRVTGEGGTGPWGGRGTSPEKDTRRSLLPLSSRPSSSVDGGKGGRGASWTCRERLGVPGSRR